MKIAILCNTSWNIYNFRMNLVNALQEKGHKVTLLAPKDDYTGIIQSKGVSFEEVQMNIKGQNPFEDLKLIWQYHKIFKRIRPDLILTFTIKPTIYGNLATRFLKIKTISNITGLGTIFIKPTLSTKIAAFLYKIAFTKCNKVFFQNQTDLRFFRKKGLVENHQTDIIPGSGIDLSKFSMPIRNFNKNALKILFVGRVIRDKGVVEFLEAAKNIKKIDNKIQFYVVGQMGYENKTALPQEEFNRYIDEGVIKYIEHTDDIIDIYKKMDVMVLPSYREGMSRALLEAAAMKMPIISSDVPGCREVVNDSVNGYLVKVRDSDDLTIKLKKLISLSTIELKCMGEESRRLVKDKFSEELVIKKYIDAVDELST